MTRGRGIVGAVITAVCVTAIAAGCGTSNNGQADQTFLAATSTGALGGVDVATRVELGHQMCRLLGKYHGDGSRAYTAFAAGNEATLTPEVGSELEAAAAVAYCPKWR